MNPPRGRPTIKEVASRAGVALSSVSRVINDHPDVSDRMRARVHESIKALGYEPNLLAAGLRRGTSRTVGFIVSDLSNPLYASIVTAAQRELGQEGYAVVVTTSDSHPDRDEELARTLRLRQVDALIVALSDETHSPAIDELALFRGPLVLLDRNVPRLGTASAVETDHGSGMRQAVCHLMDGGHERIALISGPLQVRPSAHRVETFRDVHRDRGLAYPQDLVRTGSSFEPDFGEASTLSLLRMSSPPTALIAGGNQLLVGVLRAMRHLGLEAGEQLALVSCDDTPMSELHRAPITVIDRDVAEIGRSAARLALERLSQPEAPGRRIVLPTSLVLRQSTLGMSPATTETGL